MTRRLPWLLLPAMLLAVAAIEYAMGRLPICKCGTVELWHANAFDSGTSQHLSDWYTPSHIVHGLLFYGALHWAAPRLALGWRAVIALAIEAAWEIAENTETVIRHYRESTISLDYFGDSILNSTADQVAMLLGFLVASRLPVLGSIVLVVALELAALWAIRDNLTLNILMLAWPIDAIKTWQAAR